MVKQIGIDNEIFKSEEYLNDKYLFAIFEKKIKDRNARIYSDEENYIIVNEDDNRAPWIWTKDGLDNLVLKEIEEAIMLFMNKDKMPFTCKKELYEMLINDDFELIDKDDYFEMGFMRCRKLKDTKENDGVLSRANLEDKDILARYIMAFEEFMDESAKDYHPNSDGEMIKHCHDRALEEIKNDKFFVLRNSNNKIVSMAHYKTSSDGTAKIGLVYTPEEERGKGYAAKIVHDITAILLDDNYIPVLYTDQNYPNSNIAYFNAGYENGGTLVNFSCNKNLKRTMNR